MRRLSSPGIRPNCPNLQLLDFLADHPLQKDLQANKVDIRREFYAFAMVFIEVAKRTRTPAEILAEQKLESLHRQIGGLQERLNRLPTIEGIRTEMARLAAQDYPALPGSAIAPETFSAEQCKAFALAQQMRGWFETLGFRFESHEVWQDDYFEWIINIPVRRGRYDRILVRGIDGEAGLPDVQDLREAVETHCTDEGWLVTARRISRAARDEVEKPENDALGCFTFDELLDQDADFSGYLTWLESEIEQRGIDQKYVPLACLKEEIDPDTRQRIGVSRYDDRDGWIDGYIDLWLDDPAKEHISVLGEFGTGKTWFAVHYAWKALQRYREAQHRGLERPRLPLVVPLRDYAKAVSVESLFSEFFFRKHEIPIPGYSAFEQLNRMGKLLLIFDGFDEMAARVDRQQMINNFWELAKVVVPGAKVILTCRTEHFPEAKEGRALLNAELQASTKDLTGETPQFEVLELEKFNDEQIRQVLSHQAQPTTVEQIMGNPELLDLARRPVLTELILEALPDIEAGKPVDMSRVYLYAVRHKMERDIKAERTFTSMADKLYFMCELSWEMLSTDRMSINYREFPDRIRKLFGPAVEEEKDLDHWHYDMMGQTMLIRNAEGDYTPAHRSLLEFFVAYKFAAELGLLAPDFEEMINSPQNNNLNLCDNIPLYFRGESKTASQISDIFQKHSTEKGQEFLISTFGKLPLAKAVVELILPMIGNKGTAISHLQSIILITRDKKEEQVHFLGGNAVTLLLKVDKDALKEKDLSSTVLLNSDFTEARLVNTDLSDTNLRGSIFSPSTGNIFSISFEPEGNFICIGDAAGKIHKWFFRQGKRVSSQHIHEERIKAILFIPNGKSLLSGSEDRTIKIVDTSSLQVLNSFPGHSDRIHALALSPDGKKFASGGNDETIRLWSLGSHKLEGLLKGHRTCIRALAFAPNDEVLASGGDDGRILIWDLKSNEVIQVLAAHEGSVRTICFNDNKLLASGGDDFKVKVWDRFTGEHVSTLSGHTNWVRSVSFSPNKKFIASGSDDETCKIWNLSTKECEKNFRGHTNWVRSVVFSPDGKFLASGSEDETVKVWDINNERCVADLQGYTDSIRAAIISPNQKRIASCSDDKTVSIWDIETGLYLKTLTGHTGRVRSLDYSHDGLKLASCSEDKTIRIWDSKKFDCLNVFTGHTHILQY